MSYLISCSRPARRLSLLEEGGVAGLSSDGGGFGARHIIFEYRFQLGRQLFQARISNGKVSFR
jgi:hypothetical protein